MATEAVGMYGETPRVQIGKYSICRYDDHSVWIDHEDEDGGQFPDEMVERAIEEFYNSNL